MPEPDNASAALDRFGNVSPGIPQAPWPRWYDAQEVPVGLPITRTQAWLFVPDGRIVLLADSQGERCWLPGSPVQHTDNDATVAMAAAPSRQARLDTRAFHYLGYLKCLREEAALDGCDRDTQYPVCATVSLATVIRNIESRAATPSDNRSFIRLRVTPHRAVALLGLGGEGHRQARNICATSATRR